MTGSTNNLIQEVQTKVFLEVSKSPIPDKDI